MNGWVIKRIKKDGGYDYIKMDGTREVVPFEDVVYDKYKVYTGEVVTE